MAKVTVGPNGRVTIPRAIRDEANLVPGAELDVCVTPNGILLVPTEEHDPDQWWFWTEEWQEGEREGDRQAALGLSHGPHTDEEFRDELVRRMNRD